MVPCERNLYSFIAFFSMIILIIIDIREKGYINIKIDTKLIASTCVALLVVLLTYYSNSRLLHIIALAFAILFAIVINRNTFSAIVNLISNKLRRNSDGER